MGNKDITLQVGVKILLKNKAGRYLFLRRSLAKYPEVQGRWDIAGGRIDPGKDLLTNLQREVMEETSLKILGTPKLVAAQDIIIPDKSRHVVRLTYLGNASEDEIFLDVSENDMHKWMTWEEAKAMNDVDIYLRELLEDASMWLQK